MGGGSDLKRREFVAGLISSTAALALAPAGLDTRAPAGEPQRFFGSTESNCYWFIANVGWVRRVENGWPT